MYKSILFLSIFFLFLSCNSQKEVIDVQNINNLSSIHQNNLIYTLPKTQIIVEIEVEKIIKNKGSFSEYTDKYLGALNNTIKQNSTTWTISKVNFYSNPIIDTSNTYIIGLENNFFTPITLTKQGFLVAYNNPNATYQPKQININQSGMNDNHSQNLSFNFVSSDKSYKIEYDTVYREEVYDTIIRKVPILKPNLVKKTPEEQAKELADRITILRDDRAALLVGEADNDNLPSGDALQLMLNEIDKLEADYLSMFIGRTDTLKYTFSFSYTPSKTELNKKILLSKFSSTNGLLPAENIYGSSVFLQINTDNNLNNVVDFNSKLRIFEQMQKKTINKGLYYRIPQTSSIKLLIDNQIISEKNIDIAQFGTIQFLPASIFSNPNLKIDFYPEYGSVKSISQ